MYNIIFIQKNYFNFKYKNKLINNINTIEILYFNCNWFEREISEMFNILFLYKKDTRNLLLNYTDKTFPLKKKYPTCGYYNVIYNINTETLIYYNIYIQI